MTNLAPLIAELGDKFTETSGALATRIGELERRAVREREPANDNVVASLGSIVANDPEVQRMTSNFRGKAVVKLTGENAAITTANTTVGAGRSQGTSLVPGMRVPGIVEPFEREMTIRDLLPQARTTSGSIEWPRETGFTNNAAPVAETTPKPYSDLTFDMVTTPVRTIAHMFKASRQILDDTPALLAYIDRRGTNGLKRVEENQLLFGNGTGQNLLGIVPQATAFDPQFASSDETAIDRLLQAISQAEDSDIPVTGIVLNKRDWRRIIGIKDAGGNYISPDSPFQITRPNLWNLPIVATNAMPVGQFLTGAFSEGAAIFDRMDVEVMVSSENADDFEKNLISVRIEERLALATFRPDAFITGDLYAA
ncbi:phage major capsid protein [Aurantimonas endophytica]|uniref:HK97 family phage major capsid protein n=1 Tax=Aurantimonas endophytica TaxID=1522175 RepID=A0A7W6HCE2_9HYPH|nr:phage major capsid protein [Aurantimonas endophytica]MBB4002639.1 HK97 family phage major capsid protein [Aurantimonas endophytica]MCO6403519.1 phage major capsid protein [Aurantimonas endophytica]